MGRTMEDFRDQIDEIDFYVSTFGLTTSSAVTLIRNKPRWLLSGDFVEQVRLLSIRGVSENRLNNIKCLSEFASVLGCVCEISLGSRPIYVVSDVHGNHRRRLHHVQNLKDIYGDILQWKIDFYIEVER